MQLLDTLSDRLLSRLLSRRGLRAVPASKPPRILHPEVWEAVRAHTMTDPPRVDALYAAVEQIVETGIEGDLVECGVYRGGCSMAMAMALRAAGSQQRVIWLYDTYEGMTRPDGNDVRIHDGTPAAEKFEATTTGENASTWCAADLETVRSNMLSTGYPEEKLRFVAGPVEETLRSPQIPERIALLRLDTDWYASTRVELEVLMPRVVPGGVLIIDDYNHWAGSRRAVDEYFATRDRPLLFPVGSGSVMGVIR